MRPAAIVRSSPPSRIVVATALIGLAVLPSGTAAQQLPFSVSIVTWDSAALALQQHAYGPAAQEREQLFCIDAWRRVGETQGVILYVVLRTRRDTIGEAHGIHDVGSLCRGTDGSALPMLHTHSDGNCQFSPADLATLAARGAPFDGVQCGNRYFIWQSAWQINAIANELERERAHTTSGRHP